MIIYPNAKINIGLNVVERRSDGYHNLETVFYPINLQDAIEIHNAPEGEECNTFKVTGAVLDGRPEDNLVMRAYNIIEKDFALPALEIHLFKHIPTGAGLGGGSSDAAFMIKAMNERYNLGLTDERMEEYAAELGADCAFFIKNKPVLATGIGNIFHQIDLSLAGKTIVLVKPDIFVSTKDAYSMVVPMQPEVPLAERLAAPIETWKDTVVNDFEFSVFSKYPEIGEIKNKLYSLGAIYASMSGSGSSVYGIFDKPIEGIEDKFVGCYCRQRELS